MGSHMNIISDQETHFMGKAVSMVMSRVIHWFYYITHCLEAAGLISHWNCLLKA